jgi:hypothetical protein
MQPCVVLSISTCCPPCENSTCMCFHAWVSRSTSLVQCHLLPHFPVTAVIFLLQFMYRDIKKASAAMIKLLPAKATLCFSNVRGLQGAWSFGGFPVTRIYNAVQPSAMGCVVSLLSYGDVITFARTCYTSKTSTPGVSGRGFVGFSRTSRVHRLHMLGCCSIKCKCAGPLCWSPVCLYSYTFSIT